MLLPCLVYRHVHLGMPQKFPVFHSSYIVRLLLLCALEWRCPSEINEFFSSVYPHCGSEKRPVNRIEVELSLEAIAIERHSFAWLKLKQGLHRDWAKHWKTSRKVCAKLRMDRTWAGVSMWKGLEAAGTQGSSGRWRAEYVEARRKQSQAGAGHTRLRSLVRLTEAPRRRSAVSGRPSSEESRLGRVPWSRQSVRKMDSYTPRVESGGWCGRAIFWELVLSEEWQAGFWEVVEFRVGRAAFQNVWNVIKLRVGGFSTSKFPMECSGGITGIILKIKWGSRRELIHDVLWNNLPWH